MNYSAKKLIYVLSFITVFHVSTSAFAGDCAQKQLIIIDGISGMGKSSTADKLKLRLNDETDKKVTRISIDKYYQAKLWATEVKLLDDSLFQHVFDWDELYWNIQYSEKKNPSDNGKRFLHHFSRINNFFARVMPMEPQDVKSSRFTGAEDFHADIKKSLINADIVVVDHSIDLYGVEIWAQFLQSIPNAPRISHFTLTCDYENYLARNTLRNASEALEEHRPTLHEVNFSRRLAQHAAACEMLPDQMEIVVIDTSNMSIEHVLQKIK